MLGHCTTHRRDRSTAIAQIVRAELTAPTAICRQMAADMRGMLASAGGITKDDLRVIGWMRAQIDAHLDGIFIHGIDSACPNASIEAIAF
ncbi:MAG TPA: hypothetical protein VII40_06715 [Xanthobacteraceae bacterium]|jgi:hypothetical protein